MGKSKKNIQKIIQKKGGIEFWGTPSTFKNMTMTITKESLFEEAKKEGAVLKGTVKMIDYDETTETDVLVVDLQVAKGLILREDVDSEHNWRSLISFIGKEIEFIATEVDEENGIIKGSRKELMGAIKEAVVNRLQEGEEVEAEIVSTAKYGAFVEFGGVVGLLKNTDFSTDHTTIREVKNVGDKVKVRLQKYTDSGKLQFEAVEKFEHPTAMDFSAFKPNQIVHGVVRGVTTWGVFVSIAPNLDALCSIPSTGEVEVGTSVTFRITQVREDEQRIRGKILRIHS